LPGVPPASDPNGQREANRSPKPAFNSPEMAVACVWFALFAIRFHIHLADTGNEHV
jgi:tryptophan-rich sensory protein